MLTAGHDRRQNWSRRAHGSTRLTRARRACYGKSTTSRSSAGALAQLPARQRAVLVLRYWADLPIADVADILGCSAGTVKSTTSRAAVRLAETLSRAEAAPEPASLRQD